MTNQFLNQVTSKDVRTDNFALSNSSTGNHLVDQFAIASSQRGRDIEEVFNDQAQLHSYNPELAIKFVFYLRMITRKCIINSYLITENIQKGQGVRDESFKRLLWYAINQPTLFYNNLWLLPALGSWKDLWNLYFLANKNNIELNKNYLFGLIQEGIKQAIHQDLIKKFLPRIRSNKKCITEWSKYTNNLAKEFIKNVGWSELEYRKFKTTGKAHEFQRIICLKEYDKLNFNTIPGKALFNLVKGKFLSNHNLEGTYEKWLDTQPIAKFTGYVYELGQEVDNTGINIPLFKKKTFDKQFNGLVELGKKSTNKGVLAKRNVICAIDRSSSMIEKVGSTNCMNIAESLGIYFASLMEGAFHNWVIKFSSRSEWIQLQGDSFVDRKRSMKWGDCPSNSDFQSIIDSIVRTRQNNPNILESDFPNTLIVVSDMQFDRCRWDSIRDEETNHELAVHKLSQVFSKEFVDNFVWVWWQVNGGKKDFPQTMTEGGGYVVSGFDGTIITALLGSVSKTSKKKLDMLDMVKECLNQEVLQLIKL